MEQRIAAPGVVPGAPRRTDGVDPRPTTPGSNQGAFHPLELRRALAGFHTPQSLAEVSGVSRFAISNIEAGKVKKVRAGTAEALARALEVNFEVLLGELRDPALGRTTDQRRIVVAPPHRSDHGAGE